MKHLKKPLNAVISVYKLAKNKEGSFWVSDRPKN